MQGESQCAADLVLVQVEHLRGRECGAQGARQSGQPPVVPQGLVEGQGDPDNEVLSERHGDDRPLAVDPASGLGQRQGGAHDRCRRMDDVGVVVVVEGMGKCAEPEHVVHQCEWPPQAECRKSARRDGVLEQRSNRTDVLLGRARGCQTHRQGVQDPALRRVDDRR